MRGVKRRLAESVLWAVMAASAAAVSAQPAQGGFVKIGPGDFTLLLPGLIYLFREDKTVGEVQLKTWIQREKTLPPEYQGLDLQKGDVLFMLNGQPVVSSEDCKKLYTQAEVGSEVNLGIRRGDQALKVSFPKPDPATLPRMRFRDMRKESPKPPR